MNERRAAIGRIGQAFADLATRPGLFAFVKREEVAEPPWPRPPGAVTEERFLSRCTRCGDCGAACPHHAIGVLPEAAGPLAGTPAMLPEEVACHLCEDMPCIAACETRALLPVAPSEVLLGVAEVQPTRCFAFMGPECGACVPVCPVGAMTLDGTKPVVLEEKCTGCGLCREACPVWGKAIAIVT